MSIMTLCRQRWGRKLGFFSWLIIGGAIAQDANCKDATRVRAKTWQGKNQDCAESKAS